MAKEIAEEYASSLADLTINSKPLINMLTILAEENIEHAGVIVETVEKHLEKVPSEIKLPVLYLVDSIIKNVGGAYIQKFAQSIVNMFTKTFKQVDEKTRSQMFKLRETWHEVFPTTKLYQLDVKVNLIDPAWPIQAQPIPQQSSIHPPVATTSAAPVLKTEEHMRSILAKKEQELLRLQRKKIEMELEQTRRQLEQAEQTTLNQMPVSNMGASMYPVTMPVAMVNPVVTQTTAAGPLAVPEMPVKARLGPPVSGKGTGSGRIAPASGAMVAAARRDPRLARLQPPIAPNVFDIKPLDRVTKRKNVITIDVRPDMVDKDIKPQRDPRKRDKSNKIPKDIDDRRRDRRQAEKIRKLDEERLNRRDDDKRKADENKKNEGEIKGQVEDYMTRLQIPDPKKINKLPPIPKIARNDDRKNDVTPSPTKRRKETVKDKKIKKRDSESSKESSDGLSPEKKQRNKDTRKKAKEQPMEVEKQQEVVAFKELKNFNKERYRRNRDKSESPEKVPETTITDDAPTDKTPSSVPEITETKDVDLRVLPSVDSKPALVVQKRSSTETLEGKSKKSKLEKFDILFGSEDVDLRQLPQVEENNHTPLSPKSPKSDPRSLKSPKSDNNDEHHSSSPRSEASPERSPKKDWNEVKERSEEPKKTPTKLDLVRAKLAEATKGKDRLGRPLLFSKSPSIEREKRLSNSNEDVDLRNDTEDEVNKETISLILTQAKEHFKDGKMDKNQYNTLMFQVMQLNEKLKLKEAKQRESLEMSKRKLIRVNKKDTVVSPMSSPREHNRFGDIDERIAPNIVPLREPINNNQDIAIYDSDMRVPNSLDGPHASRGLLPRPPLPMFMPIPGPMGSGPRTMGPLGPIGPMPPVQPSGPFPPMWRGVATSRPRAEQPFRGPLRQPTAPVFRGSFERVPRPQFDFDPRFGPPMPKIGMCQSPRTYPPYQRSKSPPPLGAPGITIPPTDLRILDFIDQDPMRTIDIDGMPREIRFYGETGIVLLDWDDPREIKFLPGSRRINFDNKDSVVLNFNDGYKQVEIEDQVFDIRYGAPTRELYINGKWYECFFGGPPLAILIEGKPRLVQLEGPPPQVDINQTKRVDLVAGKINLIVDAQQMCPLFLDAKIQKFEVDGQFYTIRFVDGLSTVLINEQPFKVEFGGLPRPIMIGKSKHFIRFSVVPRHVRPGQCELVGMEGVLIKPELKPAVAIPKPLSHEVPMEVDPEVVPRPEKVLSPDGESQNGGLDMLASMMPTSMAPASSNTGYSAAEPIFNKTDKIPGLETGAETTGTASSIATLPILGNLNVNDLFAKLVATGIVQVQDKKEGGDSKEDAKAKAKEDKNVLHHVNLLKPETLRVKQPALISKLYGGMQCSGCGTRFPPEHTVRYSQHLDWHFRQNRRERDSARRAHSRHWHYDLSDWVQYEEVEDLEEREKSWFESSGVAGANAGGGEGGEAAGAGGTGEGEVSAPPPSVRAPRGDPRCALCGDRFHQFYNEDHDEWHLRLAIQHDQQMFHPDCLDEYKASLAKKEEEEATADQSVIEVGTTEKVDVDEPIEIADGDDVISTHTDYESDVEVLENKKEEIQEIEDDPIDEELPQPAPTDSTPSENPASTETVPEPEKAPTENDVQENEVVMDEVVQVEEDGDDDVVLKADPVDEVLVDDDDTDDETQATRKERDQLVDFTKVKIKQEPIDPDDEPVITLEERAPPAPTAAAPAPGAVTSSIDGNTQLASPGTAPAAPPGGIRINISKSLPAFIHAPQSYGDDRSLEDVSAEDEPSPPGEEIEIEYKLKPSLQGVTLSREPPVQRGTELSGLCSIM